MIVGDRATGTVRWGGFNETKTHYPASAIKLFWLAYARHRIAEGKLTQTPELDRAMHDMIVDSVNDATALVVDATTETTGGPELPPRELDRWIARRQAANRWYDSLGYTGVNASQKTWNEGPYGRERQGYGAPLRTTERDVAPGRDAAPERDHARPDRGSRQLRDHARAAPPNPAGRRPAPRLYRRAARPRVPGLVEGGMDEHGQVRPGLDQGPGRTRGDARRIHRGGALGRRRSCPGSRASC